jgi:hypothetical protein
MDGRTMATLLKAADYEADTISDDTLRCTVSKIKIAAAAVSVLLTGDVMADVSTAFEHLAAAAASTSQERRTAELSHAGSHLTRLTNHPAHDGGSALLTSPSAEQVRALGHLGNYYYSLICKEPRQALIDAYLCTERFPALGVQILPPDFFSRDYRQYVPVHNYVPDLNFPGGPAGKRDWRGYALEKAWRVPAAGGMLLLGFVAGMHHGAAIAHGAMRAREILTDGDYGLLPPRETATASTRLILGRSRVNGFLADAKAESQERRLAVEALR